MRIIIGSLSSFPAEPRGSLFPFANNGKRLELSWQQVGCGVASDPHVQVNFQPAPRSLLYILVA